MAAQLVGFALSEEEDEAVFGCLSRDKDPDGILSIRRSILNSVETQRRQAAT